MEPPLSKSVQVFDVRISEMLPGLRSSFPVFGMHETITLDGARKPLCHMLIEPAPNARGWFS